MATGFVIKPHQPKNYMSDPNSNSRLILFNNEMDALREDCKNLDAQLNDSLFSCSDGQSLTFVANQIVLKMNHLFSIFLRDFFYPLKWSQKHCEKETAELLKHVQVWYREFQEHVDFLFNFPHQPQVQKTITDIKNSLLYNSMVMNAQPPRVVKSGVELGTSLWILHENELQNQNQNQNGNGESSPFRIFMLNEDEAAKLFANWQEGELNLNVNSSPKGNFISPSLLLNLQETRNILREKRNPQNQTEHADFLNAEFDGLKVNIAEKNHKDPLERKFCLLYTKTVVIDGVVMETWCLSLPFVRICHPFQTCAAQATIFWDNYFKTEENWLPFQVKEKITWADLSAALTHYFKSYTKTEWNLTPKNLQHIGRKIFKTEHFNENSKVLRKEFCPTHQKSGWNRYGRDMTIWRWLFSFVQLIKRHLAPFWNSGSIVGFIDRVEAENLIRTTDRGTFLIRFEDSLIGGVSYTVAIAPTSDDTRRGYKSGAFSAELRAVEDLRDLGLLSLDQRIMTNSELTSVLYFEPSLNYQEMLKPKGEIFTRPSEPDGKDQKPNSSLIEPNNQNGQQIFMIVDDSTPLEMRAPAASTAGGVFGSLDFVVEE